MSGKQRGSGLLLVVALAAGLLAAWLVFDYTGAAAREGGAPTEVLVAAVPIEAGKALTEQDVDSLFESRSLPHDFAPVDAISDRGELIGSRATGDVAAGAFATRPLFTSAARGSGFKLRASERAVSVEVLAAPDGATLAAGMRVDLLASGYSGANTTELLLAGAEVLAASENRITIRVSAAQAPSIVRGDVFAKELRAVVRP